MFNNWVFLVKAWGVVDENVCYLESDYLVSWYLRTWVRFLARHKTCTNNYILLQFPKTRGSKTLTPFTPFHTNVQSFD